MDELSVAVVGCGIFGAVHANAYSRYEKSRLVGVCDLREDRARKVAEKHGCRVIAQVEQIASDPAIEAVSVATPDHTHRDVCIRLAEAGKHILVEKPLALSVADAEAIAAAAERNGVSCMVDFHNRYNPAITAIKEKLASGEIGTPQMAFIRLSDRIEVATDWFDWSGRSGPEWFLGSHIADLACWLFDSYPTHVFADGCKGVLLGRGIDCYDSVQIHLSFPEGMATLETSWIMPNSWPMVVDFSVSVQATDGRADANLTSHGATIAGRGGFGFPLILGSTPVGDDEFGFFSFAIRDFVRSILNDRPVPIGVAEGVRNVRLIEAARQSIETGQVVDLTP